MRRMRYLTPVGPATRVGRLARRTGLAGALLACLAMVATGCGLEPASQFTPNVTAKSLPADSLKGAKLSVTSKEFTEQIILGKITVLALKAAGADVTDKTNVKGSGNSRQEMIRGDADMQWEYTGTGWITYLGHDKPIVGSQAQYDAVKKADKDKNNIDWLQWANFNNTYAMAVTSANAKKYGLSKLSDIAKVPPAQRTFCLEDEFFSRQNDGWPKMLRTYNLPASMTVKKMDTGVVYTETAKGSCLFGEVFDTDGRIPALHLTTLEDDKHAFPLYNPALTVRGPILAKYPQIAPIEQQIAARLSTQTMRTLNAKVDVEGQEPVLVARDWLRSQGLIK